MKIVMILLAGLLLAGCDTIPNSHAPERAPVAVATGRGRILISTGAASRCVGTSTFLMIRPADPANKQHRISTLQVDSAFVKSDFEDHKGSINIVELNNGDYTLYPYYPNPRIVSVKRPSYHFHVTSGSITYIGEYYMPVSCGLFTEHQFRDESVRDIALMRQRNPELASTPVIVALAEFEGYRAGGRR